MLLLVVTLLVMFLFIGVTGVIVATAYHTGSKAAARMTRMEVRHEDFTDRVLMQLSAERMPVRRFGATICWLTFTEWIPISERFKVAVADPIAGSQLLKLTVTVTNRFDLNTANEQRFYEPDFFAGRILSVFAADGSLIPPTVRHHTF